MLSYQQVSSRPTYNPSSASKRFCAQGMFFYNVKLRDGWNAGMLLQVARVDYMTECIELCCDEPACDFVMMKEEKCYTVRCRGGDTCTVEEGGDYQISFVSRQGEVAIVFVFILHKSKLFTFQFVCAVYRSGYACVLYQFNFQMIYSQTELFNHVINTSRE